MTEEAGNTSFEMRKNLRFLIQVLMIALLYLRYNILELTD
jgi:hypothetical protein